MKKKSPGQLLAEARTEAIRAGQTPPRLEAPVVAPAPPKPAPVPSPGQTVAENRIAPPADAAPVPPVAPSAPAAPAATVAEDPRKAQYDELLGARFTPAQAAEMTGYTPPAE